MKTKFVLLFFLTISIVTAQNNAIKISGFADVYYAYNFNKPSDQNIPLAYNHSRHNEVNVNNLLLGFKSNTERVRANAVFHTGTYVQANYSAEPPLLRYINEANVGMKLHKKVWVDVGIIPSHIGLETAISKDNWTLTRSFCAENSPYYESGAKVTFLPNDKWTLVALVLNGWQNIIEKNSNKAVGVQAQFYPNKKVLFNYSNFIGEGRNSPDSIMLLRHFHDFFCTYSITDKLALAAVFDMGFEQKSSIDKQAIFWYSPALFIKYKMNSDYSSCIRFDYFGDKNGIVIPTGTPNNTEVSAISINIDYAILENMLFRIEAKEFVSKDKVFRNNVVFVNNSATIVGSLAISF